jgi:hypothetical protein
MGSGDTLINTIDGPSLGKFTKPWTADMLYVEGRRGVQGLVGPEINRSILRQLLAEGRQRHILWLTGRFHGGGEGQTVY